MLVLLLLACEPTPHGALETRRLSASEYDATLADLFGFGDRWPEHASLKAGTGEEPWPVDLPEDLRIHYFDGMPEGQVASPMLAEEEARAAARIAPFALDSPRFWACEVDTWREADAACAEASVLGFAERAWRGPLDAAEADLILDHQRRNTARWGLGEGTALTVQGLLLAPRFLFRSELGSPEATSWETASRLSYFLWGTMPDDALFDAARRDALRTPSQVRHHARRMLEDPRAHERIATFHRQWLEVERFTNPVPARGLFRDAIEALAEAIEPGLSAGAWNPMVDAVRDQMLLDFDHQVEVAVFEGGGFEALLAGDLAPHRSGVLTTPAVLSIRSDANKGSPIQRGRVVLEQVLCEELPAPPPPDQRVESPVPTGLASERDQTEEATGAPACRGCHERMNALGFAFGNYDAIGAWREEDAGGPIDATGRVALSTGEVLEFDGADALVHQLAASTAAQRCYGENWLRVATGQSEIAADDPLLARLVGSFGRRGDIEALLVDIAAGVEETP